MLSFITYNGLPDQIEIIGDEIGLQELIDYLCEVKSSKSHMHLIMGNELAEYPIPRERNNMVCSAKSVRIEFVKPEDWA